MHEIVLVPTYKYFRYRPEKGICETTSILPSPTCEMLICSPRFPVRPSTLIFACRNVSKAERSKILSDTGWEQLMVYYRMSEPGHRDRNGTAQHMNSECNVLELTYLLGNLPLLCLASWSTAGLWRRILAYCSQHCR